MTKQELLSILSLPPAEQEEAVGKILGPKYSWGQGGLDWKLAKRMQAEAIAEHGWYKWRDARKEVIIQAGFFSSDNSEWDKYAKPKHYIIASLICKLEP